MTHWISHLNIGLLHKLVLYLVSPTNYHTFRMQQRARPEAAQKHIIHSRSGNMREVSSCMELNLKLLNVGD